MMFTPNANERGPSERTPEPYYVAHGEATDSLMRCTDCQRLVTVAVLRTRGLCPHCGTRRVKEIQTLSTWEWIKIRLGLIRFPHRQEFLREFGRG